MYVASRLDAVTPPSSTPLDPNTLGDYCQVEIPEPQSSNADFDVRPQLVSPAFPLVPRDAGPTNASSASLVVSNHDACPLHSPRSKSGIPFRVPFSIPDQVQCEHTTVVFSCPTN